MEEPGETTGPGRADDRWEEAEPAFLARVARRVALALARVDPETAAHGHRTVRLADALAAEVGLGLPERRLLAVAAVGHDLGKIDLGDLTYLRRAGPLRREEVRRIRRHPQLGAQRFERVPCLRPVARWVAEHHERWDGGGYPLGLRGEGISLPGRILGLVEVFDALRSRRSYKPAWSLPRSLEHLEALAGRAFDPELVRAFTRRAERWSPPEPPGPDGPDAPPGGPPAPGATPAAVRSRPPHP